MTTHQISWIIGITGFLAIGTAFVIWDRMSPILTPEQQKAKEYYNCVSAKYINSRSIEDCNLIK